MERIQTCVDDGVYSLPSRNTGYALGWYEDSAGLLASTVSVQEAVAVEVEYLTKASSISM